MAIFSFDGKTPSIGEDVYIAQSAEVIGGVTLGAGCYVGPGAILRGDYGDIIIGEATSVEENVVVHARPNEVCTIGNWVTLGHGAIIHNAKMIHDYAVIGMGAIVSDWAVIGEWAAIGEGTLVKNGQEIAPKRIAVGVPAKEIGETKESWREQWYLFKKEYVNLAKTYKNRLKRIDA